MVCLSKPLLKGIEGVDFCRGDLHRAFFYQEHRMLEDFVEPASTEGSYLKEEFGIKNSIINMGINVSFTAITFGLMYGAVKLLQYYNIVEKYVP